MTVFLDGQYLPAEQAKVSIFDRAFTYGDGLFETLPVFNGRPFRLEQHWERLRLGAEFLKIRLPYSLDATLQSLHVLRNRNGSDNAIVRLTLSRGVGPRGYSPHGADHPTFAISWHPLPDGLGREFVRWRVISSSQVVPADQTITRFKTANKLCAVLAKGEADAAQAQEALVFNTEGRVAEAGAANLFWIKQGRVFTPPLSEGALDGITRAVVQEICRGSNIPHEEQTVTLQELVLAEGVFLTLSTWGIVEVSRIDNENVATSPRVGELWTAYWELVRKETGPKDRGHPGLAGGLG